MSYEITITRNVEVVKEDRQWARVSAAEDADYDWTPTIEIKRSEKQEVLRQTVDELDLAAVIKAINKL